MAISMRAAASPWAPGKTAVMKSTVDDPAFQDTVKRAISGLPAQAVTEADTRRADMISLPIVFLLSPLIFGGLVAALVPPLLGMVAIVLSLAVPRIVSTFTDVATQGLMIVTMLGMGMAIDYSLFIISRFREELSGGHGRAAASEALARTLPTAGRTVLVSALVLEPRMMIMACGLGSRATSCVARGPTSWRRAPYCSLSHCLAPVCAGVAWTSICCRQTPRAGRR